MAKLTDETLDWLGDIFVENEILDRHGVTFETFVNWWKIGLLEKYDQVFYKTYQKKYNDINCC
ncbi:MULTISPECIES: hypothetical protein [unclassified Lysinibacillus]|uniref:hypothetical protein n=1 Tax=unclassified Lysinibacillus TaxID=2636778 RepID=UPI003822577D